MNRNLKFVFVLTIVALVFTACKNNDEDEENNPAPQTQQWEMTINVNITDPDPSPFTITGDVDVTVDGENVTFKGDFINGNLTFEDIVFNGKLNGNVVTMTTSNVSVNYDFQGTTYTENITWTMDPFAVNVDNANGGGDLQAHKTPGDITESGTFTFTAQLKN